MTLENVKEIALGLALFFNPFGYNELFALTTKLTGSYWITSSIFYALAFSLFCAYLGLKRATRKPHDNASDVIVQNNR